MSAGLPGVGLSGVFFIVSALLMLPLEIARAMRGRSSLARWIRVFRHLAIAVAMIFCLELAYAVLRLALDQLRSGPAHGHADQTSAAGTGHTGFHMLPAAPVLATLGVIATLLIAAKAAQLFMRWRKSGALAIIWPCCATSSRRSLHLPPRASPSPAPSREA